MIEMENNKQKIYIVSDSCNCSCGGVSPKKVFANRIDADKFFADSKNFSNKFIIEEFELEDTNIIKNKVEEKEETIKYFNEIEELETRLKEKEETIKYLNEKLNFIRFLTNKI